MNPREHLVYMANQIARNFAAMGNVDAAAATADHIATYWDPRMKEALLANRFGLCAIAAAAFEILNINEKPAHQTQATESKPGREGSDAG